MTEKQDLRKTLQDVLVDLRGYEPLTDKLEELNDIENGSNAIRLMNETGDPFEPVDGMDLDVVVVFGAVTENSTPMNTAKQSTWRLQVNVGGKLQWRQEMDAETGTFAVMELSEVLGLVGDRLDVASGIKAAVPEGSDGSPLPLEDDDGSLTVTNDWIVTKTQKLADYQ